MRHTVTHDWRKYHGWRFVRQVAADALAVKLIYIGTKTLLAAKYISPECFARVWPAEWTRPS